MIAGYRHFIQVEENGVLKCKLKQLEQKIAHLEIANERARNDRQRDLDSKDVEIGEMRAQYQRRVRVDPGYYVFNLSRIYRYFPLSDPKL